MIPAKWIIEQSYLQQSVFSESVCLTAKFNREKINSASEKKCTFNVSTFHGCFIIQCLI